MVAAPPPIWPPRLVVLSVHADDHEAADLVTGLTRDITFFGQDTDGWVFHVGASTDVALDDLTSTGHGDDEDASR